MRVTEDIFFDGLSSYEIKMVDRKIGLKYTFLNFYVIGSFPGVLRKKGVIVVKKKWFFFAEKFMFYFYKGNK